MGSRSEPSAGSGRNPSRAWKYWNPRCGLRLGRRILPLGTPRDLGARVELVPPRGDDLAGRGLGLDRDHGVDRPCLQTRKDLGVGVAGVRRRRLDRNACGRGGRIDALDHDLSFVHLTGGHLDV